MPRNFLTNKQKVIVKKEIIRRQLLQQRVNLDEIAEWAQNVLAISFKPSKPVLSRLQSLPDVPQRTHINSKRLRRGAQPALENALISWVNDQYNARRCVTGQMICEKGKRLLNDVNRSLPQEGQVSLRFTSGWLWRFQKRWNLKCRRVHGESGDADEDALQRELPVIQALCATYSADDIWNADETGLNYCMPPDRTISAHPLPGRKKDKKRLTVLVCANASGSEKFPLMIIGNAQRPRCFRKLSGAQHGFDYWSNKKAWMTSALFFEWLGRFDCFIRQTPGRKVLLLLDNFSGHGKDGFLPELYSVVVKFLPANTTSRLQPMDAGIICSLKRRYRSVQYNRALDALENDEENIYRIDQLTAMKCLQAVWQEVPASIIANCWRSTGILQFYAGTAEIADGGTVEEEVEAAELDSILVNLVATSRRMSISHILNSDDLDIHEDVTDFSMSESVLGELVADSENGGEDQEPYEVETQISPQSMIDAVRTVMRANERQPMLNLRLQRDLRSLLRTQRKQMVESRRQTTIDSFFK